MKTLNIINLLSLAFTLIVASPATWSAERMKSGKWEMTKKGQSQLSTECVTTQQANDVNGTPAEMRAFVEKSSAAANCTIQNFSIKGDTIAYGMTCGGVTTEITTIYHGDAYEMTMSSKGTETIRMTAKRIGAC